MKIRGKQIIALLMTAALTACGGGGGNSGTSATSASTTEAVAEASASTDDSSDAGATSASSKSASSGTGATSASSKSASSGTGATSASSKSASTSTGATSGTAGTFTTGTGASSGWESAEPAPGFDSGDSSGTGASGTGATDAANAKTTNTGAASASVPPAAAGIDAAGMYGKISAAIGLPGMSPVDAYNVYGVSTNLCDSAVFYRAMDVMDATTVAVFYVKDEADVPTIVGQLNNAKELDTNSVESYNPDAATLLKASQVGSIGHWAYWIVHANPGGGVAVIQANQ